MNRITQPVLIVPFAVLTLLLLGFLAVVISTPNFALSNLFNIDARELSLPVAFIHQLVLPRVLMAVFAGAAMAVAGCLIQQALQNDFASPSTLGINAGAMLATLIAGVFAADWLLNWSVPIAFVGALLSGGLVYLLARFISAAPINLILVGMAMSLALGAVSAALLMIFEARLDGFYIWGAGNLAQSDLSLSLSLVPQFIVLMAPALLLARRMDLLTLGDKVAGGLGLNVSSLRLCAVLLTMLLSALVVSRVGIIAFVGLIAPHLARGLGAKSMQKQLISSAYLGSVLLLLADIVAVVLAGDRYAIPTGAMTTLVGAPFMIYLLHRQTHHAGQQYDRHDVGISALIRVNPAVLTTLLGALLLSSFALFYWQSSAPGVVMPRLLVSAMAGMGLAVTGLILQTLLRNPLASPDVVGVTSSAIFVIVIVGIITPLTRSAIFLVGLCTALALFGLGYWLHKKGGFSPRRWALMGVCISALSGTGITLVLSLSATQTSEVLLWLSGTTYGVGITELLFLLPIALLVCLLVAGPWRWLNLLQLGFKQAAHLGLEQKNTVMALAAVVGVICALSVSVVGGIAFVGLMAPHIARVLGLANQRDLLPATALIGALTLVIADFLSMTLLAPFELPTGLIVSITGGLYFILLLLSGRYQAWTYS